MHARRIRGFTLTETMVALTIAGFLMLVMTSLSTSDAKMHNRVRVAEYIQTYQISTLKTFANPKKFEAGFKDNSNPILDDCRRDPCSRDCRKQSAWQPMTWGEIPIVRYVLNGSEVVDGGRYKLPNFELCEALPKEMGEDATSPPRYAPECRVSIKASWRSGTYGTLEYRIAVRDNTLAMNRVLSHYQSPFKEGRPHRCEMERVAALCKSPGAYLLNVDFTSSTIICASPDEVNYR